MLAGKHDQQPQHSCRTQGGRAQLSSAPNISTKQYDQNHDHRRAAADGALSDAEHKVQRAELKRELLAELAARKSA